MERLGEPIPLIVVTDPGQDMDDEMAMILMAHLTSEGIVQPLAVIANLMPAPQRALLARGSLDVLGMQDVKVGEGTDGGSDQHTDTFTEHICKLGLGYLPETRERIFPHMELIEEAMAAALPKSITVLVIASLKCIADFMKMREAMFLEKVKNVVVMGGVESFEMDPEERCKDGKQARLIPDTAQNNAFHMPSAEYMYERCQTLGIPITTLSRHAAYASPVPRRIYDEMCEHTTNPIAQRLRAAQKASIEKLWQRANAEDPIARQGLPARCSKEWFCETFCKGLGMELNGEDSIWPFVVSFNMYDPMALLACVPKYHEDFFDPIEFQVNGTTHLVIGVSSQLHGVAPGREKELQKFMVRGFNSGADCMVTEPLKE